VDEEDGVVKLGDTKQHIEIEIRSPKL